MNEYDRGVLDALKIVVMDHWSGPEEYSELIDKIMKLLDQPVTEEKL
jgi:hypothetical protein